MKLKASYADGRQLEAVVGPRTQVAFERRYRLPYDKTSFDGSKSAPMTEHFLFLCHSALHLSGQEPEGDFDEWLSKITDWDPVSEGVEEAPDPT